MPPGVSRRLATVDDGFDFPPAAHPGRELFTASLFVLLVLALLVWGGWKLISLISRHEERHPTPSSTVDGVGPLGRTIVRLRI
jgi:hypothetical protein